MGGARASPQVCQAPWPESWLAPHQQPKSCLRLTHPASSRHPAGSLLPPTYPASSLHPRGSPTRGQTLPAPRPWPSPAPEGPGLSAGRHGPPGWDLSGLEEKVPAGLTEEGTRQEAGGGKPTATRGHGLGGSGGGPAAVTTNDTRRPPGPVRGRGLRRGVARAVA